MREMPEKGQDTECVYVCVCVCANAREIFEKGQDIECVCVCVCVHVHTRDVSKKLILFCMKLLHIKCEIKRTERPF